MDTRCTIYMVNVCQTLSKSKERGTIRFIPELVHNLASALALRAPLADAEDLHPIEDNKLPHIFSGKI